MDKIKVVIVEDEEPVRRLLEIFLSSYKELEVIQCFSFSTEALVEIPKINPDIVFLDIQMPEITGIELARELLKHNEDITMVFTTGYSEYALEAFEVNAIDYLLKPITKEKLEKCLKKIIRILGKKEYIEDTPPKMSINCFGDFRISGIRGSVKWQTRKVEELLAYLVAHHDQNIESFIIGDALWPEYDSEKIKQNLHTTLFRLRKTLLNESIPIKIESNKSTYRCIIEDIGCDLLEMETYIKSFREGNGVDILTLEHLLKKYNGELYYNKNYTWAISLQDKYSAAYVNIVIDLVEYYVEENKSSKATYILKEAIAVAPQEELLYRRLFEICKKENDFETIKKYCDILNNTLNKDIGIEDMKMIHK